MRIVLKETGGFVGVELTYEVDLRALGAADLSALGSALAKATAERKSEPTPAGGLCIRMERDDGSNPFTYLLDTADLNMGLHSITMNVIGYEGEIGTASARIFVDNDPP